ncbi:MAG: bifunctional riboflavin kinase/FAD synthetase [Chloroflexi bacterium]|nr:bifunctional riboflavin kinase/FAD synthetase [Chloroflexota bacterium]
MHLAIGVFDGVHMGHQHLVRALRERADRAGATAVAATFDPLPIQFFAPGAPPSALSDINERTALLRGAGAGTVVVFLFDDAFSRLSARDFVDRLVRAGDVKRVMVGEDFRFGHDREGDVRMLRDLAKDRGFDVEIMRPVERDGAVVSSTRIRNSLVAGDVAAAERLLGRPYAVPGSIVHGDKRGRALGYPTINVSTPPERLLPRDGIYATRVTVGDRTFGAATSLGVRPTFGGGERVLESYLLDFSGDLYGEEASTSFVARIRDELRFENADALVARISEDVEAVRAALR